MWKWRAGGGTRRREEEAEVHNQKQEPFTKMWGIIYINIYTSFCYSI